MIVKNKIKENKIEKNRVPLFSVKILLERDSHSSYSPGRGRVEREEREDNDVGNNREEERR